MEIIKYGVKLKKLTQDKIELVRTWRNDPEISKYMEFRDHITSDMQINWFNKINNENNFYFIIEYEGHEIGLSNVKDIDFKNKIGESGIFIYDANYLNSDVPYRAVLCLNDYFFISLDFKRLIGHVLSDNKRAIRFNKSIGALPIDGQEVFLNQLWVTEKENYFKSREKIMKLLKF
jgi:UDP-4-amino-4,6-dideoxy-N-acetyl-beta-L-altrosamine N-acetyltransferase